MLKSKLFDQQANKMQKEKKKLDHHMSIACFPFYFLKKYIKLSSVHVLILDGLNFLEVQFVSMFLYFY